MPRDLGCASGSRFRSLQCTSCHALGEGYGLALRLFAGPDVVVFHALADALAGGSAPVSFRSCVLAPVVSRLPVHEPGQRTRVATAFAVWMGVEKLIDDVEDEGAWLPWLASRALRGSHERARASLEDVGFPVGAIREALARQRAIEAGGTTPLGVALEPTRTIAGLAFGALGSDPGSQDLGTKIGELVGTALFWIDNALDLPADLRSGRYNALRRAPPGCWDDDGGARGYAVAEARAAVDRLEPLVLLLPDPVTGDLVHGAFVRGLRSQIDALEALSPARWAHARTRDLQTWRRPFSQVLASSGSVLVERLASRSRGAWTDLRWKMQLAGRLLALWVAPWSAWAQDLPEEPPVCLPDDPVLDAVAQAGPTGAAAPAEGDCGCCGDPCTQMCGDMLCNGFCRMCGAGCETVSCGC
ncbi:MAG: hypothetical protein H6734_06220 [Alphaproteobacteria bacterium]|nr:hypothetical protein [Alphaproteobacteria bacterium]